MEEERPDITEIKKMGRSEASEIRGLNSPDLTYLPMILLKTDHPFCDLKETGRAGLKEITQLVRNLQQKLVNVNARLGCIESEGESLSEERAHKRLLPYREEIERRLRGLFDINEHEESFRFAVVENRLYLWLPDMTPNNMLNVWGNQYFYFDRNVLAYLVSKTCEKLRLDKDTRNVLLHLNHLINQIVLGESLKDIVIESKKRPPRLLGETLHLICDILGTSGNTIESLIEKVTGKNGRGGIPHPRLLRGKELETLRARLGAVVNSDCWLGDAGRLQYTEANRQRMKIVQDLFRCFGDIEFRLIANEENRSYRIWIPRPIGHAFIYWGFTTGDKAVQNGRLSGFVRSGSVRSFRAYLEDLISEDGSFEPMAGFRWSRTIVLCPGIYDEKYELEPKLSPDMIHFLKSYNHRHIRRDEKKGHTIVPIRSLSDLSEEDDSPSSDIAENILRVVESNRSLLLDDESDLAEKLGIVMHTYPDLITIYDGSGRISLKWVTKTKSKDDAVRWALLAPPNDPRKKENLSCWLLSRKDEIDHIERQLRDEGLLE